MKSNIFKKLISALLLMFLAVSVLMPGNFEVSGANSYQPQIDAAKKNKEELEKKKEALEKQMKELTSQKQELEAYMQQLDEAYTELYDEYEQTGLEILAAEVRLDDTRKLLEEVKQKEADQYDTMKKRVKYMYENGETSILELFLGDADLSDIFNQLEYRQQITKYDNNLLKRYNETKLETIRTEELYTAELESLEALNDYQAQELATLEALSADKANELLKLADSLGVDEEMLYLYWDEIRAADADIAKLQKLEQERLAEEERKRKEEEERIRREKELQASHSLENIIWPIPASSRITSRFGYREAPTKDATTYHNGVDIGANTGTDVLAAIAGKVTTATYSYANGNYIVIDHGNGVRTVYCHASKLLVKVGDEVQRGQVIMKVGSTGVSTGSHLHFGLFLNGTAVDPLKYVSYSDKLK